MRFCLLAAEGLALFAACLAVHALAWRVRRPASFRTWVPALAVIFGPVGVAIGLLGVPNRVELMAVLLLHLALSSVYIIGYTLLTAFSPSVELLKLVQRSPGGVPFDALRLPFLAGALTDDRIGNLVDAGLVNAIGDRLELGPRGRRLTWVVLAYRHAVGLPDGSGG